MFDRLPSIPSQSIQLPLLVQKEVSVTVKREDLIHPFVSGNKYRKLKYNLIKAREEDQDKLLTYGGAYSNHIAATAYAGKLANIQTVGVIRGDELASVWRKNPSLRFAHQNGMQLEFVSRKTYREKEHPALQGYLKQKYGRFYELPEGGTNPLAVQGCGEILTQADMEFNVVCSCVATGGTLAGLINSAAAHQQVLGFQVLKGNFLRSDIRNFTKNENWRLITSYHFGGYAKISESLVGFMNNFKDETGIQLDPIYTAKLFFGLFDMIKNDHFPPGTSILAVHTGGLQGIAGMNAVLKKKLLPMIKV